MTSISAKDARATSFLKKGCGRSGKFDGLLGTGVRTCVIDSGVEAGHPLVGPLAGSYVALVEESGTAIVREEEPVDIAGHGTAYASVIRAVAPRTELTSLRVFGSGRSSGAALTKALYWAIEQGFAVLNLSLSSQKLAYKGDLSEVCDAAYFHNVIIVAAANNLPAYSYPWRFASVVSVGSHDSPDPFEYFFNPEPPVEFYAKGTNVEVAWSGGGRRTLSGNSFAAPHVSGYCALLREEYPDLRPFQLKSELFLRANNVYHGRLRPRSRPQCGRNERGEDV